MEAQNVFEFLEKWAWAIFILVTFLNAATFARRGRREIEMHPELREGYHSITRGFVAWGNLPWVVMGVGCVYGGVPSVFSFFRPRDGNPYVLAFFCSVFLLWALGTYWLLYLNGAQKLVDHPGLLNIEIKSARGVLAYWFLSLAGGIVGTVGCSFSMSLCHISDNGVIALIRHILLGRLHPKFCPCGQF